jgi:2-succinyl-5-enolpyruvyl-6-hydroxy-3-cyclohexene-1-carboxylate synthase
MSVNPELTVINRFVAELARAGVLHVCVSPGSRSTPLTMAVARHGGFRLWSLLDERSAGFFAVGVARASGEPVALICTSGTATANYFPAVMEAYTARLPLLVLTADRPPELHDVGSNQTVRQSGMYGTFVKWQHDVAVPQADAALERYLAATAWRAVAVATTAPCGPVHLNFPFREPLIPPPFEEWAKPHAQQAFGSLTAVHAPVLEPSMEAVRQLVIALAASRRPLLVCGPMVRDWDANAVWALARRYQLPVLADPLSQVRTGAANRTDSAMETCGIDSYDVFLRDSEMVNALTPDLILRFGQAPTSKALGRYLAAQTQARQVVVDESPLWRDPFFSASEVVQADPERLLARLLTAAPEVAESVDDSALLHTDPVSPPANIAVARAQWLDMWRRLDHACRRALEAEVTAHWQEAAVLLGLLEALPDGATLVVGNSMPVRDLDSFLTTSPRSLRILANRGVSGIDGVVSTAVGAAAVAPGPTALCIGDISFYHDLGGLLAVRRHGLDLLVVVIHNDGGGIFSFLPQASHADTFEHFRTAHGLDFEGAVEMYGGRFRRVEDKAQLTAAVADHLDQGGLTVIQVRMDADTNHRLHDQAIEAGLVAARQAWREWSGRG